MVQLPASGLAAWLADQGRQPPLLIDVREPWEFAYGHIAGSQLLPLQEVPGRLAELDAGRPVVVICHHGIRSYQAGLLLQHAGFDVFNLSGGIDAWAREVDPAMPRY